MAQPVGWVQVCNGTTDDIYQTDIESAFYESCGITKKDLTHNPVKMDTEKVSLERKNARTTISGPVRMWKILKSVTAIVQC
jgi:hypothetical protein